MSVDLISNFDPSQCPICAPEFNTLVAMLGTTLDANGNFHPVGINMTVEFSRCTIQSRQNGLNDYDLTFVCGATCNVKKPQNRWLIDWNCTHLANRRGVMGMIADVWAKTKPVHPGHVLKRWMATQPAGEKETVAKITEIPVQMLDDIMDGKLPVDEDTAKKLARYFEHMAELWFRMQYDFDYYQKTGVRTKVGELPQFKR
jgi:plasmid maintenance system antidote protein VapI